MRYAVNLGKESEYFAVAFQLPTKTKFDKYVSAIIYFVIINEKKQPVIVPNYAR